MPKIHVDKCSRCPRTETAMWYKKKSDAPYCASCYRKEYVENNREKALEAQRKANQSDKSKQARKNYDKSETGREARRKADRKRYWSNPEAAKAKKSKYKDPEYDKKHYKNNKPYYHEKTTRRRNNLEKASLSGLDRDKTIEIYANCPEGYEVDHIIPIKGKDFIDGKRQQVVCGLHVFWNLQYLPKSENRKKNCNLYAVVSEES